MPSQAFMNMNQGDQIGRIFNHWAHFRPLGVSFLWAVFLDTEGAHILGYFFSKVKALN
jgi:hypothetical protein